MKLVMSDGLLRFKCPRCQEDLKVGLHVVEAFGEQCRDEMHEVHRGHPVEFIAEAPHLHAEFWGHLVRCHQPNPHPYMSSLPKSLLPQDESVLRSGGQIKQYGPQPRISTTPPKDAS